jgi:hypothetical protein
MLYAQALESIGKLDNGSELIDAIKIEINDKGKENKSLRERLKSFGDKSSESVNNIFTALEAMNIDLSGDVKEQLTAIGKKAGGVDASNKQITDLQKAVSNLQKTLADEKTAKEKLTIDNKRKTIESGLSSAFGQKVLNPSVALKYHIINNDFDIDEHGKIVYKSKGGEVVQLADGNIDQYLKDYPEAAKNTQTGGAGSSPQDKNPVGGKFTLEQVKAMTPQEVAKNYTAVKDVMSAQSKQ